MHNAKCFYLLMSATLLFTSRGLAQTAPHTSPPHRTVHLNVVVTDSSGHQWITDLQKSDFTIFDNDLPQPIYSFKSVLLKPREVTDDGERELFKYELSFKAPLARSPNEYHRIGVRVDRQNLEVRAIQGYYAQP
jgi:hypothetical protein